MASGEGTGRDQPARMWSYWRDDKGFDEALRDYYPDAAANNPALRNALEMRERSRILIEAEMGRLVREETGEDEA